jgi:hypothetical protein
MREGEEGFCFSLLRGFVVFPWGEGKKMGHTGGVASITTIRVTL